jgi:NACHT domain
MDFLKEAPVQILSNLVISAVSRGAAVTARAGWHGLRRAAIAQNLGAAESVLTSVERIEAVLSADSQPGTSAANIEAFLESPEFALVLRQLVEFERGGASNVDALHSIRREFEHLAVARLRDLELATALSQVVYESVHSCWEAVGRGVRERGRPQGRRAWELDVRGPMAQNIDVFSKRAAEDLIALIEFEDKYRSQVGDRHRDVIPPYVESVRRVPIDDIYVPARLSPPDLPARVNSISLREFLADLPDRSVVLGSPGAGKSTMAAKICHDLATNYHSKLAADRLLTPVLVLLREYGSAKADRQLSLLRFIEEKSDSRYQVPATSGQFDYMFRSGRALVIFDGLDELLDTSVRQDISRDIESFCAMYPWCAVIVTSRVVGYEEAPLDRKRFMELRLSDFTDTDVEHYAAKWFGIVDEGRSPGDVQSTVAAFVAESRLAPDLRRSPLILGLMCNIYRGQGFIPANRPAVYKKCAEMLFEKWDTMRNIRVALTFSELVPNLMRFLAFTIYSDPSMQSGVPASSLRKVATGFLKDRRFERIEEAEAAASEFVQFCTGRAWVFSDTGTRPDGEHLYQFTHRTFLEFFTAEHIVWRAQGPKDVAAELKPRISKREWDVVAQLSYQMTHANFDGAGDAVLLDLVADGSAASVPILGANFLSFASRALGFMVPAPSTTRAVVHAAVTHLRAHGASTEWEGHGYEALRNSPFVALFHVGDENGATVRAALGDEIRVLLRSGRDTDGIFATELALHLEWFPGFGVQDADKPNAQWQQFIDAVREEVVPRATQLAPEHSSLALDLYDCRLLSVAGIVAMHGAAIVFEEAIHGVFPFAPPSIAGRALYEAAANGDLTDLTDLGVGFAALARPWGRLPSNKFWPDEVWDLADFGADPISTPLPDAAWFGLFVIASTTVGRTGFQRTVAAFSSVPAFAGMASLLDMRRKRKAPSLEDLRTIGVPDQYIPEVTGWVRRARPLWTKA